jgi:hypothetical protein
MDAAATVAVRFDEWKRVVDHMKRLFAIVCGLALTLGCVNAYTAFNRPMYADQWAWPDWVGVLQFVILLVSVVPVFHGAERSLDLKYLRADAPGARPGWIILDFWLLIFSALFFVVIAQCVPDYRPSRQPDVEVLRDRFLLFLGAFFLYDVVVLLQGALRAQTGPATPDKIVHWAHVAWMAGNGFMGAVCLIARSWLEPGSEPLGLFTILLVLALLRTVCDYAWGWQFLFPPPPVSRETR